MVKSHSYNCLRSRCLVTQHLGTLVNCSDRFKRVIIRAVGEYAGLTESHSYLHFLHLPGVSTKRLALCPPWHIQMQRKANVITHPLFRLFLFCAFLLSLLGCLSELLPFVGSLLGQEKEPCARAYLGKCVALCVSEQNFVHSQLQ